jgi:NitT/TauT family transport system ATP-binding protein
MESIIRGLRKSFSQNRQQRLPVLGGLDIDIEDSEFLSIIGPSGCGKTTLLKIIAGVEKADEGSVTLRGSSAEGIIPIVWQEHRLLPWRTVLRNVIFPLEIKNVDAIEAKEKAHHLLQTMELDGFENYYPQQISGGMAQRVAIARSLAVNTDCLLMDEPFASLDYLTKQILVKQVLEIRRKQKLTIVYVTHDLRDAIELSDRIIVLSQRPAVVREIIRPDTSSLGSLELEKYIWQLLEIDHESLTGNSTN